MSDKAWRHDRLVRGYVAAYGGREDARPRPRLTWLERDDCWRLCCGFVRLASIRSPRPGVVWAEDFTGSMPLFIPASMRDAAINLRLRFIAQGFDVDDVPDEILGGGA